MSSEEKEKDQVEEKEKDEKREESEYESVDGEESETMKKSDAEDVDDEGESGEEVDDEGDSGEEGYPAREEGDGEESDKKEKKLDHDEDRRDPQYIPKRGVFYEHDDRTAEGEEEEEEKKKEEKEPPRKGGKGCDGKERWSHDLYDEHEQSPKSRDELIQAYGYDIRNEEGAPKARRRRRYGKGPNRYERNWEDESAYNKAPSKTGGSTPASNRLKKFVKKESDFPALGPNKTPERPPPTQERTPKPDHSNRKPPQPQTPPVESHMRSHRVYKNLKGGPYSRQNHQPNNKDSDDIAELAQHFSDAVINVDKTIAPIRSTVEKEREEREEKEKQEKGSKRYSTQRGRRLPQSVPPPQHMPLPQLQQPGFIPQPPPQRFYPSPTTGPPPPANPPPPNSGYPGPPPPPPVVAFLPTPTAVPSNLYVGTPAAFLTPPPLAVPPPAEVYQGGGITYYNTQSQVPRPTPSRRVKLAIPIVAPNETIQNQ